MTPYSKLDLKVLSSNSIRTDTVIGHTVLDLHSLLEKQNGKCESLYFLERTIFTYFFFQLFIKIMCIYVIGGMKLFQK